MQWRSDTKDTTVVAVGRIDIPIATSIQLLNKLNYETNQVHFTF
jgi:hypothetical protein